MLFEKIHLWITGRVQGVGFRFSTREEALRLGLSGWVRNTEDGRVEIEVEGGAPNLEEFVRWCHQGPPAAKVDRVEVQARVRVPSATAVGFTIRRH